MKTLKKLIISIFIALFCVTLVACGEEPSTPKSVTGIRLDTENVKKEYIVGEAFTSDGIKVFAVYDDSSEKEVQNYSLISNDLNTNQVGEYDIVIKYSNSGNLYELSYKVNVIEDPNKVKLADITINTESVKVSYVLGEEFDSTGLVVTANYSDNTNKQVTNYTIDSSSFDKDRVGTYRILVSYSEDGIDDVKVFNVTVKDVLSTTNYLIGIEVSPRNEYFLVGSDYSSANVVVLAVYSDGSKVDVTNKANINSSKYNKNEVGVYEIIIDYQETYGSGEHAITIYWDSFYFARVVTSLPEGGE